MTIRAFAPPHEFLSNFFEFDGTTVEHIFQAAKTTTPWSTNIMAAATPGKAKRLGRKAPLNPAWDDIKVPVMLAALRLKFARGTDLAARLAGTGDEVLVEGNRWHDNFWGDCTCGRPACADPGQNMLGKLLMQVRRELWVQDLRTGTIFTPR